MSVPARVIVDRGTEFISTDMRAVLEKSLGVNMSFIPAGEHQQNLVEWAHSTLWAVIRALRVTTDPVTWRAAVREATYQYNASVHTSTGFSPNLLHFGCETTHPGLLHPSGMPAAPPPTAPNERLKFYNQLREMKVIIQGIVARNQGEAHRRAAKYDLMKTLNLPPNSWVWVYNPRATPPEGDDLQNLRLSIDWAGPYRYEGMAGPVMAKVAKVDHQGKTIRQLQVHGSKVRLCQAGGQTAEELRKLAIQPGMLPDFPDSEVSGPLYQLDEPQEVSVQPEYQQQEYDIPDEALRTEFRADPHAPDAPHWLPVEDSIMQEAEPRDEYQ